MPKTGSLEARVESRNKAHVCDASLYFHIPFCSHKCPYCHFFVVPDSDKQKDAFLHALCKEWHLRKEQLKGHRIVSIYFGGGTPSKLAPLAVESLLAAIAKETSLDTACEITLEVNPEDVSHAKMAQFKAAGINRISLGVQSLIDEELKILGRSHSAQQAIDAVFHCHRAHFYNVSIDLMYETPTQTPASWSRTLMQLEGLPISHLSLYNLTFEPHTLFFKKRTELEKTLPNPEERLSMLQCALGYLEKLGLQRYEISAFSRPSMHSRHNTGYWLARPFIGFGPSAFSYWDKKRFSNTAHLHRYIETLEKNSLPVDFDECLPYPRDLQELLVVQLRLISGVHMPSFQAAHGPLPDKIQSCLQKLHTCGWLKTQEERLQLTEQGMLFYDSIAEELID